jgi:DNA-binding MarR family transcriptional regulator
VTLSDAELNHLRGTNLGRLFDEVHVLFDRRALGYLRAAGYPMIKSADSHVLRTMRMDGARITDMAEQAGISKQAMSKLVSAFAEHGFVEWEDDPDDGRSRIVRATEAGRTLLAHGVRALRRAENDIAAMIGAEGTETLRSLLLEIRAGANAATGSTPSSYRPRRA